MPKRTEDISDYMFVTRQKTRP